MQNVNCAVTGSGHIGTDLLCKQGMIDDTTLGLAKMSR